MKNMRFCITVVALLLLAGTGRVFALVNPSLQPGDLFERYQTVLTLKVVNIDMEKQSAELAVEQVLKGNFAPRQVMLTAVGESMTEAFVMVLRKDGVVTGFLGKPRGALEFIFYAGAEGRWQGGELASAKEPEKWNWTKDFNKQELFGTFNGHPARLAEMMADKAAGRLFFPALIFDLFKDDLSIGKFEKPVHGVALYDLDGDGRLDIIACCEAGGRVYMQTAPMVFTDRTKELGLAGVACTSVNIADVDGDGLAELLLDGGIWKLGEDGRFAKTEFLPAKQGVEVMQSIFADINGDGYPDVLISRRGDGLALYMNPGAKGGVFVDATKSTGLDTPQCGAGGTGWLMAGDWNNDSRVALFYSSSGGILMVQDKNGAFVPGEGMQFDFKTGGTASGLTGAGCFAPVWKSDRQDLIFTRDTGLGILINDGSAEMLDGVTYGNELQISGIDQLPLIAEDLNADGNVDIYLGSRSGKSNAYYLNRGYGTYMIPDRYKADVFPGKAHRSGAWGLAAGDINGDGVNDLLLGGVDGSLTVILSDALSQRKPTEHPKAQEKTLQQTGIVSVTASGKIGVLGARMTLADEKGRIVGRRDIGSNIATGCRGPDTVNMAVREPGKYVLKVRYSDGQEKTWPVDLSKDKHLKVQADRPK